MKRVVKDFISIFIHSVTVGKAEILILVGDVNDNAPTFIRNPLVYGVSKKAPSGFIIAQIEVNNKRFPRNYQFYHITRSLSLPKWLSLI